MKHERRVMKEYDYYLFDADGTLFDTTEMIYQCFDYSLRYFNKPMVSREMIFSNIGLPLKDQIEVYVGNVDEEFLQAYKKVHMEYQLSIYRDYIRLFSGVARTLSELKKRGKKCAVVSSRFRKSLDTFLKEMEIRTFFDVVMSPEGTRLHKPHPEPALKTLELLECRDSSEALFIGDASFDIECGAGAGTDTAFVNWSRCSADSLCVKPTYVIKRMEDLVV
ncbi:MAG: HAD family hydrolase [Chitinispirillaceae bacterium]